MYTYTRKKPQRKPPKNPSEWWRKFSEDFFRGRYPVPSKIEQFALDLAEDYPHLSSAHIIHLVEEIARHIYYGLGSITNIPADILNVIDKLRQILEQEQVLTVGTFIADGYLSILSQLNSGDADSIQCTLMYHTGGTPNQLPEVSTPLAYHEAIKIALRELAIYYFRNFYNFLIMKPERTDAEQQLVDVLTEILPRWQALSEAASTLSSPDEAVVPLSSATVSTVTNSHVAQTTPPTTPIPPSAQKQTNQW